MSIPSTTDGPRPNGHHYNVDTIFSLVTMVISSLPIRGAAIAFSVVCDAFLRCSDMDTPSYSTVRLWLLRIGYYKLIQPKEKADDWIWIIDHSVQIGTAKCLVILGVRHCTLAHDGDYTLTHEQVEPLRIVPMTHSNGPAVQRELEAAVAMTGVPRAVLSDGGSDLQSGIRAFCDMHRDTAAIYDVHHKTAVELKRILEHDPTWSEFISSVNAFKLKVQQTPFAPLAPPAQRSKSRYMNLDILLHWLRERMLPARDMPMQTATILGVNASALEEKLAWLTAYEENIQRWDELSFIVDVCNTVVRRDGYGVGVAETLVRLWPNPTTSTADELQKRLLAFVQTQSAQAHAGERLPGCSDIIESVFGKFKHLEGEHAKSGFSGSVLAIAAMVSITTHAVIQRALETTTVKDVKNWIANVIGRTVQGTRHRLLLNSKSAVS